MEKIIDIYFFQSLTNVHNIVELNVIRFIPGPLFKP